MQVEQVAGDLQAPQVRFQPCVRVGHVGGHRIKPGRQPAASLQLVRAPVDGQGGVEAFGDQRWVADRLGEGERLLRERDAPVLPARVAPGAGERGGQSSPGRVVLGADEHLVQVRR